MLGACCDGKPINKGVGVDDAESLILIPLQEQHVLITLPTVKIH